MIYVKYFSSDYADELAKKINQYSESYGDKIVSVSYTYAEGIHACCKALVVFDSGTDKE